MKTLIIIAHPDVEDSSTQQFLLESSTKLPNVTNHYLTEENIDIKNEQQLLKEFDRIIFQFPMYWYSAPYILKKWLDHVFDDSLLKSNLLKNKELGLVVSLGVAEESFAAGKSEKFTLSEIFRPFEALANKCGMIFLPIFPISLFPYMEEVAKKKLLIDYQLYLTNVNQPSFKAKEAWFLNRLDTYIELSNDKTLPLVKEAIMENRDYLDELLLHVEEMR